MNKQNRNYRTKLSLNIAALVAGCVGGVLLLAGTTHAAEKKRFSPHETVSAVVDGSQMTLVYGRPRTKSPKTGEKRKIWGGLVPFDTLWRTGADEATLFTTQKPIVMGGKSIPAGTYSLYTLPSQTGTSKLIVNKQVGQWGTKYDQTQDLARIDLEKKHLDQAVDQFTMAIEKVPSGGGALKMMWEETEFGVTFTVTK
jgi:hypothetical protein